MKLEDQVCSFQLSKKLKELDVKQNSIFVWEYFNENAYAVQFMPRAVYPNPFNNCKWFSAFSASELLNMLPNVIDIKKDEPFNYFRININKFVVFYNDVKKMGHCFLVKYLCDTHTIESFGIENKLHSEYDENICNALAKMIIYLIENKLMEII